MDFSTPLSLFLYSRTIVVRSFRHATFARNLRHTPFTQRLAEVACHEHFRHVTCSWQATSATRLVRGTQLPPRNLFVARNFSRVGIFWRATNSSWHATCATQLVRGTQLLPRKLFVARNFSRVRFFYPPLFPLQSRHTAKDIPCKITIE